MRITQSEKQLLKELIGNKIKWLTTRYFDAEKQILGDNKKQWLNEIQEEITELKLLKGKIS